MGELIGFALFLCRDSLTNGPALHVDNGMVSVPTDRCGRQAEHMAGANLFQHAFEAKGRDMVAFVHHHVAVVCNNVVHRAVSEQALKERDVYLA
jgi:hypothetical protein